MASSILTTTRTNQSYRIPTQFTIVRDGRPAFTITTVSKRPLIKEVDVLKHLFQSRLARDTILTQTRFLHFFKREGFFIRHSLLSYDLLIPPCITDEWFCDIICDYYAEQFLYAEDAYVEDDPDV